MSYLLCFSLESIWNDGNVQSLLLYFKPSGKGSTGYSFAFVPNTEIYVNPQNFILTKAAIEKEMHE